VNERLLEIGEDLQIDETAIANIRRRSFWDRFRIPVVGGAIALLSAFTGYLAGIQSPIYKVINDDNYPYAAVMLTLPVAAADRKLFIYTAIITGSLSVIGFLYAFQASRPVYELAMDYGVWTDERRSASLISYSF
jgi:hypothetical protein